MTRRRLLRGNPAIVGSLGAALATQGFVLVSGVLAARLLGPEDRGYLAIVWTISLSVTQLGTLGLPLAVTYEIASGRATPRSLLRDLGPSIRRQAVVVTGLHAAVILAVVSLTDVPAGAAWVSVAIVPASFAQTFALAALQGSQRFRAFNLLRLISVAVYAGSLPVIAVLGLGSLTVVTAAWIFGWVVAGVVTVLSARRMFPASGSTAEVPPASPAELRRFGLRGLLGWVSPTETLRIDQLAVGLVLSAYDLGLYVAALAFTNLPRFVAQAIGNVAYPRVAATSGRAAQRHAMWRYTMLGAAVSFVTALALAIAAEPMIRLAFGTSFSDAAGPLRLLLLATAILCVRRVLADAMRGAGFPGASSRAEAASWITLIPALPILGLTMGLDGVAVALGISYTVSLLHLLLNYRATDRDSAARANVTNPPAAQTS